jgi:hypothetical protein
LLPSCVLDRPLWFVSLWYSHVGPLLPSCVLDRPLWFVSLWYSYGRSAFSILVAGRSFVLHTPPTHLRMSVHLFLIFPLAG